MIYIGLGLTVVVAIAGFFIVRASVNPPADEFGNVLDEPAQVGRIVDMFPGADEEYFAEMDHGLLKKPADG